MNTAIDALSHLFESGANRLADRCSNMIVFEGLRLWRECLPCLSGYEPLGAEAAKKLMEASVFGGMAIAQTGTTIPHALSYMLTYEAHIPHGAAVGAFQANYLRYAEPQQRDALLSAAGFLDADSLDELIRSLAPVSADRDLLTRSAESVLAKPEKLAVCPYELNRELMMKIASI